MYKKEIYAKTKQDLSQVCKTDSTFKKQCNPSDQQAAKEKPFDLIDRCRKAFDKHPIIIKFSVN